MKFSSKQVWACAILALTLALVITAGCARNAAPSAPPIQVAKAVFVNEAECRSCHADIVESHQHTHHAHALHFADKSKLGELAPSIGPIPKTPYTLQAEGDQLYFVSSKDPKKRYRMDYALGSGKLAMTYISLTEGNTLMELRMSYYPSEKRWYVTPGQESVWDDEVGFAHDKDEARQCLGCYSTTIPETTLRPEEHFMGIGCQNCHGPASTHVEAMKAGKSADSHMERIGTWNATRVNELCGKCHRSPSQVGTSGNEVTMTQRFQPYGLMQSRCFQQSGDTLSCLNCHDPHDNVSKDAHNYDNACLRCHSGSNTTPPPAWAKTSAKEPVKGKLCPVNPKEKCVSCHMPARKVFPNSQLPIAMADHLIWAYKKKPAHPIRQQNARSGRQTAAGNSASMSVSTPPKASF